MSDLHQRIRDLINRAADGINDATQWDQKDEAGEDGMTPMDRLVIAIVASMSDNEFRQSSVSDNVQLNSRFKEHDRVRVKFGVDRGHYGTVVSVGGDDGTYYGIKLDCHQEPVGYSEYELELAEQTKRRMNGVELINQERQRQINEEGFSATHDDDHSDGEIALAAALYATPIDLYARCEFINGVSFNDPWPWDDAWDKRPRGGSELAPNGSLAIDERIRQLTKAGALIAAEIDRLQRLEDKLSQTKEQS